MDAFSRSSCGVMETKETFQILVCFSRRMDLVSMMLSNVAELHSYQLIGNSF